MVDIALKVKVYLSIMDTLAFFQISDLFFKRIFTALLKKNQYSHLNAHFYNFTSFSTLYLILFLLKILLFNIKICLSKKMSKFVCCKYQNSVNHILKCIMK